MAKALLHSDYRLSKRKNYAETHRWLCCFLSLLFLCQFHYMWNGRTHTQWLRQWTWWSVDTVKCYSRLMSVLQWKLWINKQVSFKCHSTFYLQICCSFTKNMGTLSQVGQWGTFFYAEPWKRLTELADPLKWPPVGPGSPVPIQFELSQKLQSWTCVWCYMVIIMVVCLMKMYLKVQ